MEFITFGMEKNEHHAKLIEKLIGNRHVRADKEYFHNPTNITNILFNDEIERIPQDSYENMDDQERALYYYPFWNIWRFGMSSTILNDKTIYIGGEHEDYYDPCFHIYNDVIVIDNNDNVTVYTYPVNIFPHTDFHKAIHIDNYIWIIGNIGHFSDMSDCIQVFRLNLLDMKMENINYKSKNGHPPPFISFKEHDKNNKCELLENGTSIKVTSKNNIWILDTITCEWETIA